MSVRSAVLCLVFGAALGCDTSPPRRVDPDAVDDYGVAIPRPGTAARVVSLGPSTTEILFALGAGDRVVGRSRWDGWPEAARALPEVGDAIRPSIERVVALEPDLVVLYAATDNRGAAEALGRLGIPVTALRIDRIDDYYRALAVLGRLTQSAERAQALTDSLRHALDQVAAATRGLPRKRVFVHVWGSPLMTVGAPSFLSELLAIAGGENVYADRDESAFVVSTEDVAMRRPDLVAVGPTGLAELAKRREWAPYAVAGRLIVLDTALTSQPSLRLGEAAWTLARQLHPSLAQP